MEKIRDYIFAFLGIMISPVIIIVEFIRSKTKNKPTDEK